MRARFLLALAAACLLGGAGAASAMAAPGDLSQKAEPTGCISESGNSGACAKGVGLNAAASVTVSPGGTSAYVASESSSAVAIFDRAADGSLTQKAGTAACVSESGSGGTCVEGVGLITAASVTVSPDGTSAYVASSGSDAVAIFDRAADGSLTQKAGTAACVSESGSGGTCVDGVGLDGAQSVTVSPDGSSVYVASFLSDAVAIFDRAADGSLTQKAGTAACVSEGGSAGACADGVGLDGAYSVTTSPDGTNIYVASFASDAVAIFDRAADGSLTQKPGTAACVSESGSGGACIDGVGLNTARSVSISPDGASAYVASANSSAVAIFDRAADGSLTQKAGTAACVSESGSEGACADGVGLITARSVSVSPDGASAYVASSASDAVAIFDRAADGSLTQRPGTAACVSESGSGGDCDIGVGLDGASTVTVSPEGGSAYVASSFSDAVAIFDRELSPPPVPPTPAAPPDPPPLILPAPAPLDTAGPRLSALSLSPARFRAAKRGPSIIALKANKIGSRVSYRLSEPAKVRFKVERALPGRRAGKRCAKPNRGNREARRCNRHVTVRGSFVDRGEAGRNTLRFSGRIGGRKLASGRYRLRVVAIDGAGNRSQPVRYRGFRVRRS